MNSGEQIAGVIGLSDLVAIGISQELQPVHIIVRITSAKSDELAMQAVRNALYLPFHPAASIIGQMRLARKVSHECELAFGGGRHSPCSVTQVEIGLRKIVKIFNIELAGPAILVIFILDSISAIVGVNDPLSFGIDRFPKIRGIIISEG